MTRIASTPPMPGSAPMAEGLPRLVLATTNPGKLAELSALLAGVPYDLVSLSDVGIDQEVDEPGDTLEENASHKAASYARLGGLPTLADDSGLEVDALGGEPGPRSSRYAGPEATDADRIAFLLSKLDNIPEESWTARFRCVIALAQPGRPMELFTGECQGRIVRVPRGGNGFGYDPIFLLPQTGKTMAELTSSEKNRISHRSLAARKAMAALEREAAGHGAS